VGPREAVRRFEAASKAGRPAQRTVYPLVAVTTGAPERLASPPEKSRALVMLLKVRNRAASSEVASLLSRAAIIAREDMPCH
jgi:hypothetical protein